jgi:hypothetical protein
MRPAVELDAEDVSDVSGTFRSRRSLKAIRERIRKE